LNQQAAKKLYGVRSIPMQFVIGRNGKILAQLGGYQAGDLRLEAALARAGVRVDPAILQRAEQQAREREAEEAKRPKAGRR